jgi:hypothetical protein
MNQYDPRISAAEFNEWIEHLREYLWYRCRLEFDVVEYRMRKNRNKKWYQERKLKG